MSFARNNGFHGAGCESITLGHSFPRFARLYGSENVSITGSVCLFHVSPPGLNANPASRSVQLHFLIAGKS
jgi:hypothetical protein